MLHFDAGVSMDCEVLEEFKGVIEQLTFATLNFSELHNFIRFEIVLFGTLKSLLALFKLPVWTLVVSSLFVPKCILSA